MKNELANITIGQRIVHLDLADWRANVLASTSLGVLQMTWTVLFHIDYTPEDALVSQYATPVLVFPNDTRQHLLVFDQIVAGPRTYTEILTERRPIPDLGVPVFPGFSFEIAERTVGEALLSPVVRHFYLTVKASLEAVMLEECRGNPSLAASARAEPGAVGPAYRQAVLPV